MFVSCRRMRLHWLDLYSSFYTRSHIPALRACCLLPFSGAPLPLHTYRLCLASLEVASFSVLANSYLARETLLSAYSQVVTKRCGRVAKRSPLRICSWLQLYYTQTSRELRRLLSVARSPVSTQFAEAAAGASTIRAFDAQPRFTAINEHLVACTQRAAIAGAILLRMEC